jgi:hypothetical protein
MSSCIGMDGRFFGSPKEESFDVVDVMPHHLDHQELRLP